MPQVLKAGGVWVNLLSSTNSPGDEEPPHSLCDHLQSVLQMNFVCFNISGWTLTLLYSYNILITSLFTGNHGNHRIHWVLFYSELTVIHVYVHKLCMCYCVYRFYCYSNSQVIVLYQPILYLTSIHSLHLQVLGTTFYSGTPLNGHPRYNGHFWKSWLFLRRLQKPLSSKHPTTPYNGHWSIPNFILAIIRSLATPLSLNINVIACSYT